MNIAFFEIREEEREFFQIQLKSHALFFFEGRIQDELTRPQTYDIVSIFVHSQIDADILDLLPSLKYLQTRSTGFDHVKCKALYLRGIQVSNVAGYAGPAVGEFAFSLLLNATRHTYISLERSKNSNGNYFDLKGVELYGKTIGILGLGTIGLQMAKIAKGFGMRVLGYTRTYRPVYDDVGVELVELDKLLEQVDVLMPALPLTPTTKAIINTQNATQIKPNAIIINIARCEIMESSLYVTLPNIIASDVCSDIALATKPNFLYTPHMAYYTSEALQRISDISLENMQQFIAGKRPQNCLKSACEKEY